MFSALFLLNFGALSGHLGRIETFVVQVASRLLGVGTPDDCTEAGMIMGEIPPRILTDPRNGGRPEQEN